MTAIKIIRPLTPELTAQLTAERKLEAEKAVLTARAEKEVAMDAALLQADDIRIKDALDNWHEAGRAIFEKNFPDRDYDKTCPKTAVVVPGNRFIQLKHTDKVLYLVDRMSTDHQMFSAGRLATPLSRMGTLESWNDAWIRRALEGK